MAKKSKIKVTQIGSARSDAEKKNVTGLGLRRIQHSRVLEDTPSVRGMVTRVSHLVKVEEVKE